MRETWIALITALVFTTGAAAAGGTDGTHAPALCRVCSVLHGESEVEPVRATRTHDGIEYGFCSEDCARTFAADPAAFVPPVFPRPAPEITWTDLEGRDGSLAALAGRVVLLDFWATWCAPCRKSMPELQALHDRHAARGFTVVGVSIDEGGPARVRKFIRSKKITYPIALDSGKPPAWEAFRVKAVPAAFLIDREGRIVAQWTGAPPAGREIEEKLEELLRPE